VRRQTGSHPATAPAGGDEARIEGQFRVIFTRSQPRALTSGFAQQRTFVRHLRPYRALPISVVDTHPISRRRAARRRRMQNCIREAALRELGIPNRIRSGNPAPAIAWLHIQIQNISATSSFGCKRMGWPSSTIIQSRQWLAILSATKPKYASQSLAQRAKCGKDGHRNEVTLRGFRLPKHLLGWRQIRFNIEGPTARNTRI